METILTNIRSGLPRLSGIFLLLVLFTATLSVRAQTITPASGGTAISADDFVTGSWTSLNGPVITEQYPGQLEQGGTIVLNAPDGFLFNAASTITIAIQASPGSSKQTLLQASVTSVTSSSVTLEITRQSYTNYLLALLLGYGGAGQLTVTGLQVRPDQGTVPNQGMITNTGTTAPGGTGSVSYGNLALVPGSPSSFQFEDQIPNTTVNAPIAPAVSLQLVDQFGNAVNQSGVSISINLASGSGSLSGTTVQATDSRGKVLFNNLVLNQTGDKELAASAAGFAPAVSNMFTVQSAGVFTSFRITDTGGNSITDKQAGESFGIKIQAVDGNGQPVTDFNGGAIITSNKELAAGGGMTDSFSNGILVVDPVIVRGTGSARLKVQSISGAETGYSNSFQVSPGTADADHSLITATPDVILNDGSSQATITVQLQDAYGNNLTQGGHAVLLSSTKGTLGNVTDNDDGTYSASLTSTTGTLDIARITGTLDGNPIADHAQVVFADFYTWTSSAPSFWYPTSAQVWNQAGNWDVNQVPGPNQVAYIPASPADNNGVYPVITSDEQVGAIIIESGATVTVQTNGTLTVTSLLTGEGNLFADHSTLTLKGDVTLKNIYGGTSIIKLNGNDPQQSDARIVARTLRLNNSSGIQVNGFVNVLDSLKIPNGIVQLSDTTRLLAYGSITGNGSLNANRAALQIGGNVTLPSVDASQASVSWNGSTAQTIPAVMDRYRNLTIDNAANVSSDHDLVIADTLGLEQGLLIMKSGTNLIARHHRYQNGLLEFQRQITGSEGWRAMGSPLQSTYGDLTDQVITQGFPGADYNPAAPNDTLQPNVLYYDETAPGTANQRWRAPGSASDALQKGRGIFTYVFDKISGSSIYTQSLPRTLKVQGKEFGANKLETDLPVTYTATADTGWNFVSNPYGATIDWNAGGAWTRQNIDDVVYVWDPATKQYLVNNGTGAGGSNGLIAPFQGFWVKASGPSPALRVRQSAKVAGGAFRGKINAAPNAPIFTLTLTGDDLSARTDFSFTSDGHLDKDNRDAYRLMPMDNQNYLQLFSLFKNGQQLLVNNLPVEFGVPVHIPVHFEGLKNGVPVSGRFEMQWPNLQGIPEGWHVYLLDRKSGERTDLEASPAYNFTVSPRKAAPQQTNNPGRDGFQLTSTTSPDKARFELIFEPSEKTELPQKVTLHQNYPNPFNPTTTIAFELPVESRVTIDIFDVMGRRVQTISRNKRYSAGYHKVTWNGAQHLASGVYLYRMRTADKVLVKKMTLIK